MTRPHRRIALRALGWAGLAVIAADTALAGLPESGPGRFLIPAVTVLALLSWGVGISRRPDQPVWFGACMVVTGLSGAALEVLRPESPGYVLGFMAAAGLGLRLPRRPAVAAGIVVIVAVALTTAYSADGAISVAIDLAMGGFFLFLSAAYNQSSRLAQAEAERRLAEEAALQQAREETARLSERGRLARELHDVLAHTLSGLSVQLEGARLLAAKTDADPRLTDQIAQAARLAREGMAGASRAVATLRGESLPGPDDLAALVAEAGATFTVTGTPRSLPPESGLALYRTVQEGLTNTAKHAGPSAQVTVTLDWADEDVAVSIRDSGGTPATAAPSSGFGLTGLAERAALAGGRLQAGPDGTGWLVTLRMPTGAGA